jgi:hypothetical protein
MKAFEISDFQEDEIDAASHRASGLACCPINAVVSMGRRNTGPKFTCRILKSENRTRTFNQTEHYPG